MPYVKLQWVFGLSLLAVLLSVYEAGGFREFLSSSQPRGFGQFEFRDASGSVKRIIKVLSLPLEVALAIMSSLLLISSKRNSLVIGVALLGLIAASAGHMWSFSRGAGFAFGLLAFLIIRFRGRKGYVGAAIAILTAFYLGGVGYEARQSYYPGVVNFFNASFVDPLFYDVPAARFGNSEFRNPLDAMPALTRKASMIDIEQPELLSSASKFVWNMNPLPSEIFPVYPIGQGLSSVMGTVGVTGLTTPAMGEVYYVFGYLGILVYALFGRVYSWFEQQARSSVSFVSTLCLVFCVISMIVGLHGSTRAMTRPLVYGVAILFVLRIKAQRTNAGERAVQS
ncbi:MAG: hypothetical protein AAGB19_04050 [Cyanobacteria bacterium P01_F01_bin.3]